MSFGVCTDACLLFVRCLQSSCTQTASAHTKHLLAHAPELVVLHTIHTRSGSANTKAFGSTNIWSAAMRWSPSDGVWRCERHAFICSVRIEFIRQMSVWPRLMAGHADVGRIQKKKRICRLSTQGDGAEGAQKLYPNSKNYVSCCVCCAIYK